MSADPAIVLEGVTKRYRGGGGIEDIDLVVESGEVFGFLGPNGAGKTTAIRLMLDLIRPNDGRISIFGRDAHRESVAVRKRLGYLPGELALYERLTARRLLAHFAQLRDDIDESEIEAKSSLLELDLDRVIRTMSKGNRQKVGLAAALMGDPDLLLLDEPTSGLDPIIQAKVHAEIRRAATEGRTVLLSSHVLSEVGQVADRVGLIRQGRLITVERVAEMRGSSAHLVEVAFDGPVDVEAFRSLPGVQKVEVTDHSLHLEVTGSLDPLVAELGHHALADLEIREPTLEELFLTFYEADHG